VRGAEYRTLDFLRLARQAEAPRCIKLPNGDIRIRRIEFENWLAESFRAELTAAARKGEAFDTNTGRPVSMHRTSPDTSWYQHACAFVDMKWPRVAATTRRTHAEALTAVTTSLMTNGRGRPQGRLIRVALARWAFNTNKRDSPECPGEVRAALGWIERHTEPVSVLAKPETVRLVLDGLTVRLDGRPASASVVSSRRKIFSTTVEYAVERGLLD